jgi:hypothetical protein
VKNVGNIEVFFMENGLYIFGFNDVKMRDEVLEAEMWHL